MKEEKFNLNTIEEAVADIKAGRMVIVIDDADRENEGDIIMASEKVSAKDVNFITKYGRGILCVSITKERADELNLGLMVDENTTQHKTPFTVPIDYIHGTTTGISASDRAATINAVINPKSKAKDFARPGHIFPLIAAAGGVLKRAGHTEAAVDLVKLAGLIPSGILCEIMAEDGSMARTPQLIEFADKYNMKIVSIADLIEYRRRKEKLIAIRSIVDMPTRYGNFKLHLYENLTDPLDNPIALVKGEINQEEAILVRVHSECLTGDVFGSKRCDCGDQLEKALEMIEDAGKGVLLYMRQEGRGIGFANKILAYSLQEKGSDTVEANELLGFKADLRDYGIGAQILKDLGLKKIKLMTNNPKKIIGLKGYDLEIIERIPIEMKPNESNKKYIQTKQDKMGHLFSFQNAKKN